MIVTIVIFLLHLTKQDRLEEYDYGGADLEYLGVHIYREPNNESAIDVSKWKLGDRENPEFLGTYAEGDILFPRDKLRNGIISESRRWPFAVVPYAFSEKFWFFEKFFIWRAMAAYHRETCIRFIEKQEQHEDYIRFIKEYKGCFSSIGRIYGEQSINLQTPACLRSGTIIHELMHAIGFAHEHARYDRDDHIIVVAENIMDGMYGQFRTRSNEQYSDFGEAYDYFSIMHYSEYAFSKNSSANLKTMIARDGKSKLGLARYFSARDIRKINKMYNCKDK